jgi:hypothetical protein
MFTRLFSSDGDGARAGQSESGLDRVTGSVSRLFGRGDDKKPPAPAAAPSAPKPAQLAKAKQPAPTHAAPAQPAPAALMAEPKAPPQPQPQYAAAPAPTPPVQPSVRTPPANDAGLLSNQPMAPVGTFDSRWGNWR